mgnify:CR=1 FL=1
MPLQIPATVTGLEASIQAAAKKAGKNLQINLGSSAKSVESLSQPLGRITGKADQFTKSMEAANARVLAFGASVGVLSAVTKGFKDLITTTIEVEKQMTAINSILGQTGEQLSRFKKEIFDVAKNTEQSFDTVANAALELSRQGLKAEEVQKRLNDALILSRLSGLGAAEAVAGLTAAINSFNREGVTSAEVLNKLSAAAVSAAVSERDLIEGIKRSGAVAIQAGVSLDELVGVITAVQEKTARGGAVIGNSFKTIFTRIQSIDKLRTMQNLGIQISDVSGNVLSGTQLIQNLAKALENFPDARRLQIAENLVGKFQIAPFLAILDDYSQKTSTAIKVTEIAAAATNEAYGRNIALNETLSTAINQATVNLKELANTLGEIGVTDSLKNILGFFNSLVSNIKDVLEGEGLGSDLARGIVKGISNVLSGPGLAIFGAIIAKLTIDLVKFGTTSLQTFFGLNKTAKDLAATQGQIASTLLNNKGIQQQILSIENSTLTTEQKRVAQTKFFTVALNEQLATMVKMQGIASRITPGVVAGTRGARARRGAMGFIPNYNQVRGYGGDSPQTARLAEQRDINRGVGGAPSDARPVTIPNFAFGGGEKGTMIANNSEFVVPNYAGGGSAIFTQEMAQTTGLPAGARRVGAGAAGYIPNFARVRSVADYTKALRGQSQTVIEAAAKKSRDPRRQQAAIGLLGASTVLNVPAQRYGVAALFPGKVTDTASMNITGEKSLGARMLQRRGVSNLQFSGIQIRSLQDMQKNQKGGMNPSENRRKIGRYFASGLLKYGSDLVGKTFKNDELTKIKGKLGSITGKGGSSALFSSSVEGGIFESAVNLVTKGAAAIDEFKSHVGERAPFDFEEGGTADNAFKRSFGFSNALQRADAKRTASNDAVRTIISKALNDRKETSYILSLARKDPNKRFGVKRAAGGFIPNYSASPLQDAIQRESAAGVPVNQIRVNQDSSLRNSRNPMGLAVTNMRDEPTGAIPNFAKGRGGDGGMDSGFGGFMTKLLVLQGAFGMLSGVLGEVTEKNQMVAATMQALNIAMIAFMTSSAFGGMGNIGRNLIGRGTVGGRTGSQIMSSGRAASVVGRSDLAAARRGGLRGLTRGGAGLAARGVGLSILGPLKIVGGALLRFAGPVGLAAGAVMGAVKIFNMIRDANAGTAAEYKRGADLIADSSKRAAKELSELKVPDEFKEGLKGRSEEVQERVRKSIGKTGIAGISNKAEQKQLDQTSELVKQAVLAGRSEEDINKILESFRKEAGTTTRRVTSMYGGPSTITTQNKLTMQQARDRRTALANLSNVDVSGIQQQLINQVSPQDRARLASLGRARAFAESQGTTLSSMGAFDPMGGGQGMGQMVGGKTTGIVTALATQFEEGAKQRGITLQKGSAKAMAEQLLEQETTKGGSKLERIAQMRADIAQAQLTTELKINEIKSQRISQSEKDLATGQALNTLSAKGLLDLQKKISLEGNSKKLNIDIGAQVIKQINASEQLEVSEEQRNKIREKIQSMSAEDLQDSGKRKDLFAEILKLADAEGGEATELNKVFEAMITNLIRQKEERDKNIEAGFKQKKLDQETLDILKETRAELTLAARKEAFDKTTKSARRRIQIETELSEVRNRGQRGADPVTTRRQEVKLLNELKDLEVSDEQIKAVKDANTEVQNFLKTFKGLSGGFETINAILTNENIPELARLQKVQDRLKDPAELGINLKDPKQSEAFKNLVQAITEAIVNLQTTGLAAEGAKGINNTSIGLADNFKNLSRLLSDFSQSLRQATEQLKFDFLFARSGSDMISSLNRMLETNERREGSGSSGDTARATANAVLEEREDRKFLSRTRAGRRSIEREDDVVRQQMELQIELADAMKAEGVDSEKVRQIKEQILQLEKERLEVNDSLAAKMEDAFVFSQAEIQNTLTDGLVRSATSFTNKISDGLVDAIAKGEDLGSTLRKAAADFFLDMARANMRAAMQNFTSGLGMSFLNRNKGGMINGGSGVRDDIPTMLTGGEFVMNRGAVERYGPDFMAALNRGAIQTMQGGGLFTPGSFGQGAISGSRALLSFSTQYGTSGFRDEIVSGNNFAGIALEPQSVRMTRRAIARDPASRREQQSKQEAFGAYSQHYQALQQYEEQKKAQRKALLGSIGMAVLSAGIGSFAEGFGEARAAGAGYGEAFKSGFTGFEFGGEKFGGLGGIFRGRPEGPAPSDLFFKRKDGSIGMRDPSTFSRAGGVGQGMFSMTGGGVQLQSLSNRPNMGFGPRVEGLPSNNFDFLLNDALNNERQQDLFHGGFGSFKRATGGSVPYAAGVDTVPTMLSGGEFVMNAAATQNIGRGNLAALNSGAGGDSGEVVNRLDELIDVSENRGESTINITVNSDGSTEQDGNGSDREQSLAVRIRDVVRQVIDEEKRLGGSLRQANA